MVYRRYFVKLKCSIEQNMCGVLFSSPFIKSNAVGQLLFMTEVLTIVLKINSIVNYYRLVLIEVICLTVRIKFGQN